MMTIDPNKIKLDFRISIYNSGTDENKIYKIISEIEDKQFVIGFYFEEDLHKGLKIVTDYLIKEYLK